MKNIYTILLLLLIGNFSFGQTTIAQQDFDAGTPDWGYTPNPTPYGTGSDDWEVLTTNADPSGTTGSFWGIQDINNGNGGGAFEHTLSFNAIDISSYENVTINFSFYTVGFDSTDYLEYEVFYGSSGSEIGQGRVSLNKNTTAWTTISENIPDTADSAYIVIIAFQNGGSDYAGLDNFSIEGDATSGCSSAITSFPFNEGFEGGTLPACWTQEYESASVDWIYTDGNNNSLSANTGSFNALFASSNYNGDQTKLVTPALDLSAVSNPTLTFYHTQPAFGSDQDELRLYYKTSAAGAWILIPGQVYTSSITSWTQQTVLLPNPSSEYYIAFDATSGNADGITIDDVQVTSVTITTDSDSEAEDSGSQPTGATISSLADTSIEAIEVFGMDFYDYGTADGLDTEVTKIRIIPHTTNTADWSDHIQGVTLSDGSPITVDSVTIDDAFIDITFASGDLIIFDSDLISLSISIYLNTSNITDGSILSFAVDADNHGFEADVAGSTFAPIFSGGDFNSNDFTIDVDGSELTYVIQPTDVIISTVMTPSVKIGIVDANGNIDIDFSGTSFDISLTTDGSFDPIATTTVEAVNGVANFNNLIFDTISTGIKLTATDPSPLISGTYDSNTFNVTSVPIGTTDLLFSEYIEGSSNNKYIEIYNGTGSAVTLTDYSVELYSNGSSSASNTENFTSGFPTTLADGEVLVLENSSATIYGGTAYSSTVCNFNGDDAIVLKKSGIIIDIIGNIGCDPGSEWTGGGNSTKDRTLVRKDNVCEGITTDPTGCGSTSFPTLGTEWNGFTQNTISNLGSHTANCGSPLLYTYNGTWSPSNPNGVSTSTENILVVSGEAEISSNTSINLVTVNPGATLTINSGVTLTVTDNVTLESSSTNYSNLIYDGTIVGTIKYERYVNANSNGNDLITPPLSGQSWSDFLTTDSNSGDLLDNGNVVTTTYAFAPFDKSASDHVNYTSATTATLNSGVGYRAATDAGTTLTFTGSAQSAATSINIISAGSSYETWNLIGNPYPSYIVIQALLEHEVATGVMNIDILEDASGIYGYDGDATWNVITLANDDGKLMTPGQGFFVAAEPSDIAAYDFEFTPIMRAAGLGDDFIVGRDANPLTFIKLTANSANNNYSTELYFNTNSSKGLDKGYDAQIFGGNTTDFALYSHLIEDNNGLPIALQSLNLSDLENTIIPLGINTNQGEQLTLSLSEYNLPSGTEVYLEDNLANTSTLLTASDYTLTPNTNLNGTGRFYLRVTNSVLSTPQNTLDKLSIYNNQNDKTVVIAGQILEATTAKIYDIQGRIVNTSILQSASRQQTIDVSSLNTGVYVVQVINGTQNNTQKVIIR